MPTIGRVSTATAALFIVYAAVMISGWPSERAVTTLDALASVVVPALAAVFSVRAASVSQGRRRRAWLTLCVGLAAATVAEIMWAHNKIIENVSNSTSLADAAYLLFPVGVLTALLLFAGGRDRRLQIRLLLDGIIVGVSLLIVTWLTVMQPVSGEKPSTTLEAIVPQAYPISHVVTLTVAAMALARRPQAPLTPLALGLAAMTLAESAFAYTSSDGFIARHNIINVGWMAGMMLIMVAAENGHRAPSDNDDTEEMPGWASVFLPYAPLMLAASVVAFRPPDFNQSPLVLVSGVFLIMAVLARQLLAFAENHRLLAAVADRAMRDPLTGLANRVLFQDRLEHALALRRRDGRSVGVLMLDLDDFKLVNDTMGHAAGDELLTGCGARLSETVRGGDTVARLGGDEFAIMFEGRLDQWLPVAHRVVETFDQPFVVGGHELLIQPSAGLSMAGSQDEDDLSADELLKRADTAMYSAKRSGGRGVQPFKAEMYSVDSPHVGTQPGPQLVSSVDGAAIVRSLSQLRQAVDRRELCLVYQPKVDAHTRRIVGVEALLRWPHPERGLLGPEEFLPLVRQYGLMGVVTDFVVDAALDDSARWHAAGVTIPVAVNLFAALLGNLDLPETLTQALAHRGLGPEALMLEITEDLFFDDLARTRTVLDELRRRGIRIAIDDFGSGYSALAYLSDLPIDEIKLASNFIAPALADSRAATVLSSVIDLAHRLGLVVVAEAVESAEMATQICGFDCDILQGFYFSPPVPADDLLRLISAIDVSPQLSGASESALS